MFYYLYRTTNLLNGKQYIGAHSHKNLANNYLGSGKLLKEDVKRYGWKSFKKEILLTAPNYGELLKEEAKVVSREFVLREDVYNIDIGGRGYVRTSRHSELGRINFAKGNDMLKQKRKDPLFVRETSRRISEALKNRFSYCDGTFLNRKHILETKRKIGAKSKVHQKGVGNSQFGTHWYYHPILLKNRKVRDIEVQEVLAEGWVPGRIC